MKKRKNVKKNCRVKNRMNEGRKEGTGRVIKKIRKSGRKGVLRVSNKNLSTGDSADSSFLPPVPIPATRPYPYRPSSSPRRPSLPLTNLPHLPPASIPHKTPLFLTRYVHSLQHSSPSLSFIPSFPQQLFPSFISIPLLATTTTAITTHPPSFMCIFLFFGYFHSPVVVSSKKFRAGALAEPVNAPPSPRPR